MLTPRRRVVTAAVTVTYATLDPTNKDSHITLSSGNLRASSANSDSAWYSYKATIGKSSGKWYWEVTITAVGTVGSMIGMARTGDTNANYVGAGAVSAGYYSGTGGVFYNSGGPGAYGNTYTSGDIISVAYDAGAGSIWFRKNGTWQNSGDPAAGTNPAISAGLLSGTMYPAGSQILSSGSAQHDWNFGATAFTYSVPSGFNSGFYT